jgi:hypothetical protein
VSRAELGALVGLVLVGVVLWVCWVFYRRHDR